MIDTNVITLARWLARKRIRTELRAMGHRLERIEARKLSEAANAYFIAYREELIAEAMEHPALIRR
jgi:hypothetical protein